MRSIKHSCDSAAAHHQLAALAITQVGMMRKFRSSDGFRHDVVLDQGEASGTAGEYVAAPGAGHQVIIGTETTDGCVMGWRFTWPDLKLLLTEVVICEHTGFELETTESEYYMR